MTTLDTASKHATGTPTSGSLGTDDEEHWTWGHGKPESLSSVVEETVSAHFTFGINRTVLETHALPSPLARPSPIFIVHARSIHPVWDAPGDYTHIQRDALKQEVDALLADAGTKNWDGEGALALQQDTVGLAQELVDYFPHYIGLPDVAATPHGEVDFDWVISQDVMLTLSVAPSREIAFAGLFNGARMNGCEPWVGALPHFVQCAFERLRDAQSP